MPTKAKQFRAKPGKTKQSAANGANLNKAKQNSAKPDKAAQRYTKLNNAELNESVQTFARLSKGTSYTEYVKLIKHRRILLS